MKVDGANGVGADKLERTMRHIQGDLLSVKVYNNGAGVLNERVSTLLYCVALLPYQYHSLHFMVPSPDHPYMCWRRSKMWP